MYVFYAKITLPNNMKKQSMGFYLALMKGRKVIHGGNLINKSILLFLFHFHGLFRIPHHFVSIQFILFVYFFTHRKP